MAAKRRNPNGSGNICKRKDGATNSKCSSTLRTVDGNESASISRPGRTLTLNALA